MTTSANFPNRPFRLEQRNSVYGNNGWNGGNQNLIHTELWIIKNSYSPSYSGSGSSYAIDVSGNSVGSNGNFGFDFRNSDSLLLHASDNWFSADSNGYMNYSVAGYCTAAILGYTQTIGNYSAPRIPRPPYAPFSYPTAATALTNITASSMQYRFFGTDSGGSTILEWQLEYSTTSNFAGGTVTALTSSGTSTVTGLASGTQYWFRARGRNAQGWGAYSDVATATTLASVKVSNGSSWLTPTVLVSDGTQWRSPSVFYSKSAAWLTPLT